MNEPKQVIVVRKDLGMRKGKMIAQGSHASMKVFFDRGVVVGRRNQGKPQPNLEIGLTEPMAEWVNGVFAKIVVGCGSEEELLELHRQTLDAGIPCALITDVGRTEFHGVKTFTCIAIGPADSDEIDKITGHLKLL